MKLAFLHRRADVVGCYQWVADARAATKRSRQLFTDELGRLLDTLAQRNLLVLLGDFNTTLAACDMHIGSRGYRHNGCFTEGSAHADAGSMHELIRHHQLCVLNTFGANGPTYQLHDVSSRIDFIITRLTTTDGHAKNAHLLHDAPVRTHARAGHIPVLTTLPVGWMPQHTLCRHPQATFKQRQRCREDWSAATPSWTQFLEKASTLLRPHLETHESFSIMAMNTAVLPTFINHYGSPPQQEDRPTSSDHNKWYHLRMMKRIRHSDLQALFSAWHHWTRFQQLDRHQAQQLKSIKKATIDRVMALAAHAEQHHDSYGLYKIINETTGHKPKHRLQLRTHEGDLATPIEAQAQVRAFVQSSWDGPRRWPLPTTDPPGVPFDRNMLLDASLQIPTSKAVAPGCIPGPIWRELALQLVDPITQQLTQWWGVSPPFIPPEWRNAWLSLIPKPNRKACHPSALRPLALQEPIGKSIIGILGNLARDQIITTLVPWPQMAFLPLRSTQDCIVRVITHCRAARELIASQKPSITRRARQAHTYRVCGGVQLCADITRAFDAVTRPRLFEALNRLGVSSDLVTLLQQWHMDCEYILTGFSSPEGVEIAEGYAKVVK